MNTTVTIDWLAYTVNVRKSREEMLGEPDLAGAVLLWLTGQGTGWTQGVPHYGYRRAWAHNQRQGLTVYYDGKTPDMGVHVAFSGNALKGQDMGVVLHNALTVEGKVKRIDIALDVNRTLNFRDFFNAGKEGRLNTPAKKVSIIEGNQGTTVYIGSRASSRMLRVYDKAAQMGETTPRTRIELEVKGETAHGVAVYLSGDRLTDIPSIIRAFCDWPEDATWAEIFAHVPTIGVPKERRVTDRHAWVEKQVRPALTSMLRQNDMAAVRLMLTLLQVAHENGVYFSRQDGEYVAEVLPF